MAFSIRIPWLVDLLKVTDKTELRLLTVDTRLDRRFEARGPLINRMLLARVNRALRIDGRPLPTVAPRDDAARARSQHALRERLRPAHGLWDTETLTRLVAAVRGTADVGTIGPAVQQAVGRIFVKSYIGDDASFGAARDLDDAIHSRNPFRLIMLHLTGRLRRSRRLLAERVEGDLAGVHATGVAVHNMVHGLEAMRELWRMRPRPSADDAVRRSLFAPPTVLRQATTRGGTAAGEVRAGTLVLYQLDTIARPSPDAETVFMADNWAECPALEFVPALLRAVWEGALAAEKAEKPE